MIGPQTGNNTNVKQYEKYLGLDSERWVGVQIDPDNLIFQRWIKCSVGIFIFRNGRDTQKSKLLRRLTELCELRQCQNHKISDVGTIDRSHVLVHVHSLDECQIANSDIFSFQKLHREFPEYRSVVDAD